MRMPKAGNWGLKLLALALALAVYYFMKSQTKDSPRFNFNHDGQSLEQH